MTTKVKDPIKALAKAKASVLMYYPGAKVSKEGTEFTIIDTVEDDLDILQEYFLPYAASADDAWHRAALTVKTTQNFNRTHPEKMSLEFEEEKMVRLNKRRTKKQR